LWFWIAIALIAIGIALTAILDVFYWLIAALAVTILMLIVIFLIAAYRVGEADPSSPPRLQKIPDAERIPVIYDCDVTMGWPLNDVGDGLALLYLLGESRVDLRCVTTTYGNGPVWMTTRSTRRLLSRLGLDDIAVVQGAGHPNGDPQANQAAQRLEDAVNAHPNKIVLLATGALTNLKHASTLDPDFFKKLRGLHLMGGVTEPLVWNERTLKERNFSLDPEAAYQAIQAECPVTLVPGQAGLTAVFRSPQFAALQTMDDPVSQFIARKTRFWFALMKLWFHDDGFAMWDSVAALALTHPELFDVESVYFPTAIDDLHTGRVVVDTESLGGSNKLVRGVRDYDGFIAAHLAAWRRLGQRITSAG